MAPGKTQLLFGCHLCRQAVAVPPEATLDTAAPHGLEAGDGIFHKAGEQVPVMGQPIRERGSVVEDILGLRTVKLN